MGRSALDELYSRYATLILAVVLAGCTGDDDRLATYPVEGSIVINGQPAAGCVVSLVPIDSELKGAVLPAGTSDESGRFRLTTYETGDGAPAGRYGVTLRWEANEWPGMDAARQVDPVITVRPDRLLGRFSSPSKSGLEVTIAEHENALEPFRLDDVELLPRSK